MVSFRSHVSSFRKLCSSVCSRVHWGANMQMILMRKAASQSSVAKLLTSGCDSGCLHWKYAMAAYLHTLLY